MKTARDRGDDLVQILCDRLVGQMAEIEQLRALVADVAMGLPLSRDEAQILDRIIKRKDRW